MNRQAFVISWLAYFGAVAYVGWRGWQFVRDYLDRIGRSKSFTLHLKYDGETLWLIGLLIAVAVMMFPWIKRVMIFVRGLKSEEALNDSAALVWNMSGRWLLAICLLLPMGGNFGVSLLLAIGAMILVSPEFTAVFSSGFTTFIDAVFFPGGREKKPPYTLKLARFYVEKQRWEDAEIEYARMLSFYPDQPEAWQERLALAFRRPAPADPSPEEILAAGFKALRTVKEREALHRRFSENAK